MQEKVNYTYMLQCKDGSYYTGWTNNLDKRVKCHQQGKGGHYTHAKRPVILVHYEEYPTKQEAMKREWAIKHLSRKEKEQLVLSPKQGNILQRIIEINEKIKLIQT